MTELTKEWLLRTIADLEEERDAVPGVVNEDAAMALAAMKLALASLEAEPVAYIIQDADARSRGEKGILRYFANISDEDINEYQITVTPLYIAPPAPVSVPAAMEMDDDFDSAFEHGKAVGWNAYRAAMLQSFGNSEQLNSPAIPDGWVLVPKEPTPAMLNAAWVSHGIYHASAYRTMLAAAPQQEVK
ncbi:hypothetical protein AAH223_003852 [Enterobacter hormaechei]